MLTHQLPATAPAAPAVPARTEAFTFGDPTPVLDGRGVLDYLVAPEKLLSSTKCHVCEPRGA